MLSGGRRTKPGFSLEAIAWVFGLAFLAIMDPYSAKTPSLCPLKAIGISWCPGCGLGHSIGFLFRGDLSNSFRSHPLGIPAVILLAGRIVCLVRLWIRERKEATVSAMNEDGGKLQV